MQARKAEEQAAKQAQLEAQEQARRKAQEQAQREAQEQAQQEAQELLRMAKLQEAQEQAAKQKEADELSKQKEAQEQAAKQREEAREREARVQHSASTLATAASFEDNSLVARVCEAGSYGVLIASETCVREQPIMY